MLVPDSEGLALLPETTITLFVAIDAMPHESASGSDCHQYINSEKGKVPGHGCIQLRVTPSMATMHRNSTAKRVHLPVGSAQNHGED